MDIFLAGFIYCLVFALGTAIGSFLSVVVHRVPAGLSIVQPASHCPKCGYWLKPYENVPILGWLSLKGRCSHCRTAIPIRYPLLELTTGIAFLLIFQTFGSSWQTLGYWIFFGWLLALALIDFERGVLPNELTQPGLVAGLIFQIIVGAALGKGLAGVLQQLIVGVFGAVLGIWVGDLIRIFGSAAFGKQAMGGGDPKLMAMMGAWLGWQWMLLAGFLACAVGAAVGMTAIALGWLKNGQPLRFGPFLAIGSMMVVFWGDKILSTYHQLFFPTG